VAQQYLGIRLSHLGHILRDPHVAQGVMQTHPFVLRFPNAPATKCMRDLAHGLARERVQEDEARVGFFRRFAQTLGIASSA